ncbi:MAG: DUF4385 domain-containing protein [Timaviella obliquedivisa GSE-PSE-MK23-08B]|nr:DUF4385 domain-containing protein [Timaviella obliquedivisa GSE-PSE-MK23-08B]
MVKKSPSLKKFDYSLDFKAIDFRQHPELYCIGKGEQGVLLVEPYKSEILPYWRFKTPEIAQQSAEEIYALFLAYKEQNDFVGMDMARKFLQMGYTRSRRYANHKSGRKYDKNSRVILPREEDPIKAQSAKIFYETWQLAKTDSEYLKLSDRHRNQYEQLTAPIEAED